MTQLERDHPRLKAIRDNAGVPPLEQFQCGMCGAWFLMRKTLERHKAAEIPAFIEASKAKNLAWERTRRRPYIVPKEQCE